MLLKNLDVNEGLFNGARGVVTGFVRQEKGGPLYPTVTLTSGREVLPWPDICHHRSDA
jgi:hypothetical protein